MVNFLPLKITSENCKKRYFSTADQIIEAYKNGFDGHWWFSYTAVTDALSRLINVNEDYANYLCAIFYSMAPRKAYDDAKRHANRIRNYELQDRTLMIIAGAQKDIDTALIYAENLKESSNVETIACVGRAYERASKYGVALDMYLKGCALGDTDCEYKVAEFYRKGLAVNKDLETAKAIINDLFLHDEYMASYQMGLVLWDEGGYKRRKAYDYFVKASTYYSDSYYYIGFIDKLFVNSRGNYSEVINTFLKCNGANRTFALLNVGDIYLSGTKDGQDLPKAQDMYEQSIASDTNKINPLARIRLGRVYASKGFIDEGKKLADEALTMNYGDYAKDLGLLLVQVGQIGRGLELLRDALDKGDKDAIVVWCNCKLDEDFSKYVYEVVDKINEHRQYTWEHIGEKDKYKERYIALSNKVMDKLIPIAKQCNSTEKLLEYYKKIEARIMDSNSKKFEFFQILAQRNMYEGYSGMYDCYRFSEESRTPKVLGYLEKAITLTPPSVDQLVWDLEELGRNYAYPWDARALDLVKSRQYFERALSLTRDENMKATLKDNLKEVYTLLDVCPVCGGEYRGLYGKKCSKCGRPKL